MTSVLASKAVLASLSLSRWNGHRIDKTVTDRVNKDAHAASDAGRYNKKLLSTEQMASVLKCVTSARNYHYKMTLPWFDEGARLLPSKLFLEYTEHMRDERIEFEKAATDFARAYPDYIEQAKGRLGNLFDPADFPDPKGVRAMFSFDIAILPCPDTDDFRIAVGKDHADEIRLDVEQRMKKVMSEAGNEAMERAAEIIGHMAERLRAYQPGGDTTRTTGQFRDSLVEHVREIARLLPSFNLANNKKIADITSRIDKELCEHDARALREDADARTKTAESAEEILEAVREFIA